MSALAKSVLSDRLDAAAGFVESSNLADLACIYDPAVNLCVVRRKPDPAVLKFVDAVLSRPGELAVAREVVIEHFDFSCLLAPYRELPGHRAWTDDVARIVNAYCDLFDVPAVGLRIRTLDKPMCPRFHVDYVTARMVCTYGGPGTEWLANDAVDRTRLGPGANGLADDESGVILDTTGIRAMPAYAIGLMKGERWEGNEGFGAVHRSPALGTRQPRRLLLTMDGF